MKKIFVLFISCLSGFCSPAQLVQADTLHSLQNSNPVYNSKLFTDTNSTSFFIEIEKEVKPHMHRNHSEHVYVIDGEADMLLLEQVIKIKKGSFIFIPQNTVHAVRVSSANPLKIISVQSPQFDGGDRIFVEQKW